MATSAWLMKAEPDSRIVKGKDVAFSADIFEKAGVEHWDGVRNHEAKKIMKESMKVGDQVLFYHSNCKIPGVAALAKVYKEGYPDFTAFDSSHPYHDPKSDSEIPTWYMVDVQFVSHLPNFVPLKLLQALASLSHSSLPVKVQEYLTPSALEAIKSMPLLNRGRLSVQPCSLEAFEAVRVLGNQGGWERLLESKKKGRAKRKAGEDSAEEESKPAKKAKVKAKPNKKAKSEEVDEQDEEPIQAPPKRKGKKDAAKEVAKAEPGEKTAPRRSTRSQAS